MHTYKNKKSGVLVTIHGEAKGDWELVPDSLLSSETPKKETPKPKRKTKRKE